MQSINNHAPSDAVRNPKLESSSNPQAAQLSASIYQDHGAWKSLKADTQTMPKGYPTILTEVTDSNSHNSAAKSLKDQVGKSDAKLAGANNDIGHDKNIPQSVKNHIEKSDAKLGGTPRDLGSENKNIPQSFKDQLGKSDVKLGSPANQNHGGDSRGADPSKFDAPKNPADLKHLAGDKNNVSNLRLNPVAGIDKEGFNKPADGSDKSGSIFGDTKGSVQEKVRDKIVKGMNETDRKGYEDETARQQKYREDLAKWSTQGSLGAKPPEAPKTPLHDRVDQQVEQAERRIRDNVRGRMTQEERTRLATQEEELRKERSRPFNPAGTGDFRKPPEPGPAIKEYWRRLNEEAKRS